jgi:pimeloyl-ACP methyl ester carboxylesterase
MIPMIRLVLPLSLLLLSAASTASAAEPLPPATGTWNGFARHELELEGKKLTVIAPDAAAPGLPWVWHGEFFGHRPVPDVALLGRGFHIVYLAVPNLFGAPEALEHWDRAYRLLTETYGFAPKAALVGLSRGGLYCYNWASQHPERVACVYADAPVCDLKSWPLGHGAGPGTPNEIPKLLAAYGVSEIEALLAVALNPVDRLAPLAEAGIPLLHVYGDADELVPWEENTGVLAERYEALGGSVERIAKPGVGHVHGLDDATPIVEFIVRHALAPAASGETSPPLAIGTRLELFVDGHLVERFDGAGLRLHPPRDEGVVFRFDQPWEGAFSGYATILHDGERYRLYYRGKPEFRADGLAEVVCYAESADGIEWTRPTLRLHEYDGSPENNLILVESPVAHNFSPFLDSRPGVPEDERFKALGGAIHRNPGGGLVAFASGDGIRWRKLREAAVITEGAFDSQNLAFWSEHEGRYVAYFRTFTAGVSTAEEWRLDGLRGISRATSEDFLEWTETQPMRYEPPQTEHLYTNQTQPYFRAPHLYLATAARFFPGKRAVEQEEALALGVEARYARAAGDVSDAVLLSSRDGETYLQTFREALLRPGSRRQDWVSRSNYPALNIVQTGPEEMSLYVAHDYGQTSAHLRRYVWPLDRIASVGAGFGGGEFTTRPLVFDGERLHLNFATSAAGSIRVGILDERGEPLPGRSLAEADELFGDHLDRLATWGGDDDLSALAGQPVRLRFAMKDADLYALRFE